MKIISRYLTNEIFWAFVVITGILLLIVLSNRFALYLAKAATGELPLGLVFRVVGLYIPELLTYLIPLGLFVGLLFAYGRLYADSEMTILAACGVSLHYIIKLTLFFAFIVMLCTATLTLWVVPNVTESREKALSQGETFAVTQSLLPGRFQTLPKEGLVFYIEDTTAKEDLKGVFIAQQPTDPQVAHQPWTLITADQAQVKRANDTQDFYLILKQGVRYSGTPGNADYTVIDFKEYGRAISQETNPVEQSALRQKKSAALFVSSNKEDVAELQWRVSLPLTVPILALLAVPLARVRPRQGRFAKFLPAIVLYIIYYNLFTISKRWIASGVLPSIIGTWWVHGVFVLLGICLVAKESGSFRKLRYENFR